MLQGNDAASPAGSASDDDVIDDVGAEKGSGQSSKRPAGEGLSQHEMQTEYVEKIIEEVEKKGGCWCGIERMRAPLCRYQPP